MLLTSSAGMSAGLSELFDEMAQTFIMERLEPLATVTFSGRVCGSCPATGQTGQESNKRGSGESPGGPSALPSPH